MAVGTGIVYDQQIAFFNRWQAALESLRGSLREKRAPFPVRLAGAEATTWQRSAELLAKGPIVLTVFRGSW